MPNIAECNTLMSSQEIGKLVLKYQVGRLLKKNLSSSLYEMLVFHLTVLIHVTFYLITSNVDKYSLSFQLFMGFNYLSGD